MRNPEADKTLIYKIEKALAKQHEQFKPVEARALNDEISEEVAKGLNLPREVDMEWKRLQDKLGAWGLI